MKAIYNGTQNGLLFFSHRPLYVDILVLLSTVYIFTGSWLGEGLPGEDFPGNVSLIWYFKQYNGAWSSFWFNGFSLTLLKPKLSDTFLLRLENLCCIACFAIF